ncbi:hypothetical protein LAZ67_9001878 [Cordylochernes scorpioides]|uniref:Chitin-binding type-2 domain-containing protein n=1 Tax=Cordylochernes scorpioides TaxID=51811 RepID=A0ABY6KTF1_9ARAC|nr:hypothetical protein LAZ67_9001878 [Cordylochernes scorpioides]
MEEQTKPSNDTAEQTIPKQEATLEEEETSPPQDTSADPLTQIADALSKLLVARSPREIDVSPYDGTFEAQSFFDNFDAQADRTELTYTDRLRKLPCYLQARQRLIDLFPVTTEASFARFLAIKLTSQMSLEDYYQNKTVMGMKLDLPADILIESLTDGLPVADQRLVATVQPNTIKEWFDLVSCHTCQIIKRPKDTIAGFSKYGHSKTYLHVIVDHLTRYAWTFPSKSTSTLTYIQTLKTVLQQGSPKRLLSDRAPAFTSEKFRKFLIMHVFFVYSGYSFIVKRWEEFPNVELSFDCEDRYVGFYADIQFDCRIFHMCDEKGRRVPHLCPNGTRFNQRFRVCDWQDRVNCEEAPSWFYLNERTYETPPPRNSI